VSAARRRGQRGQAVVELAFILPLMMMLLLSFVEMGYMFMHYMGLEYADREAARTGAALASGDQKPMTWPTVCTTVDNQIIAAAERTLRDQGSPVTLSDIATIKIYRAIGTAGTIDSTAVNVWRYTGSNTGPTVDGARLSFSQQSANWSACTRNNGFQPDTIGVQIDYTYHLVTPVGALFHVFSVAGVHMVDATSFVLNP
jgi:hypothetical protein